MQSIPPFEFGGKRVKGILPKKSSDYPLVTVVTVVFNASSTLEATIQSVLNQTYENIEYIIIDGGSTDGTRDIIRKYEDQVDYWLSRPDKGVYDAMNSGIKLSTGEWLNFLNANDVFFDSTVLERLAASYLRETARFIYSDVMLKTRCNTVIRHACNHETLTLNHQSSVYRKNLHDELGMYIVAPGLTISDYFFFSLIRKTDFLKADRPIAIYDTTGLSQSQRSVEQKFITDYLINGLPKAKFLLNFSFYYYYRNAKSAIGHCWCKITKRSV